MQRPLRVLLVEDNPDDAQLIARELTIQGFAPDWQRVDRAADYVRSLKDPLDVILSDYCLPGFDVMSAMALLREHGMDIPFIVISGTIGEERAVEVMKAGADDYLLKDRLQRLGSAIDRAIEAKTLRRNYKLASEALRGSERRYKEIFLYNPQPMWLFDLETCLFLDVNHAAIRHYGYSREEFLAMSVFDIRRSEDRPKVAAAIARRQTLGGPSLFTHLKKNGSLIDVEITASDMVYDSRRARLVLAHDVTDRRQAEEALVRNQQRTQFALKAGGIGIWDWDAKTGQTHWSETLEQIHGLAPFTFDGTMEAFVERVHPDDRAAVNAEISSAMAEQRDATLEYRTVWPDDSTHLVSSKGRFFRDDAGAVVSGVGIGIDVTARRELESQLVQAQKMEAVGQLAGGIAHDFNNLLTAILGYAELLTPVVKGSERHRKDLEQIRKAAMRATRLTGQLLAFSRRQILQPVVIDVTALMNDVAALLRPLIGENIRFTLALNDAGGRIKADPGQIEQVLMNLAINARDAMPDGGMLTFEAANIDVDDEFFRRHGFANESATNQFVVLAVSDTGCGMDAAVRKRIFEPFFTTKPKGKGTGLGLATVYGIVKQSGGSIWVYSELGQGTTFKIYLPRTEHAATTVEPVQQSVQQSTTGAETILLVEDEEAVRLLSRALLERHGYRVFEAVDAEQAIRIAGETADRIHLLVTDVVMPGQSGPQLYDQLTPLRPEMKVLYLSGYTDESIVRRGVLTPGTPFLQKPFTAAALSLKVRDLLDGREAKQ